MTNDKILHFAAAILAVAVVAPAVAQTRPAIEAPVYKVGDTWVWGVQVNNRDTCTSGIGNGAKETQVVKTVTDAGYVTEFSGPRQETKFERIYDKSMSFEGSVNGNAVKSALVSFPLTAEKAWETTLVGGSTAIVVTTLKCQSEAPERMKFGAEDVDVVPITCKGNWKNLSFNTGDTATYKQWYAPAVGNFIRRTVFTYYNGRVCVDVDSRLETYTKGN